jgi:5-deoxy-glucuronate isomerase
VPGAPNAFGYQRVYGTRDRPINVLAEVHSGDVVLVPHGYHGPSMAPPGYDMYYLNVMAGPGLRREWLVRDDPDHTWVRKTWASQKVDPRLPFGGRP